MPKRYFQMIPTVDYDVDGDKTTKVAIDILRRVKLRADALLGGAIFYNYQMQEGDNAEIIADKYYGSSQYHWVVLLMNDMSMHTINIEQNALNNEDGSNGVSNLVTLFTQLASDTSEQSQDVSRCSFTCNVEKIPDDSPDMDIIRMRYSITHVYADQVMDSPKFAFYRLVPEKIYFVGGFGVMAKWVDVIDYKNAAPDILSKEATMIVKKLNREFTEDLEGMATHLLGVDKLEYIRVTNVDRLGMDVRVTRQQGTRRNKLMTDEYRIGFRIPVISVEDAKSEILKVFQESWEKGEGVDWGDADTPPGSTVPIMKIAADGLE